MRKQQRRMLSHSPRRPLFRLSGHSPGFRDTAILTKSFPGCHMDFSACEVAGLSSTKSFVRRLLPHTSALPFPTSSRKPQLSPVVLDPGNMIQAQMLNRPSLSINSNSVADIQLDNSDVVLAYVPSAQCSALHGSMQKVWVSPLPVPKKTSYVVNLYSESKGFSDDVLVGVNPKLAEKIALNMLASKYIPEFGNYRSFYLERYPIDRMSNIILEYDDDEITVLQVLNVSSAESPSLFQLMLTGDSEEYEGFPQYSEVSIKFATFPSHAPIKKSKSEVPSKNAIRKLHSLYSSALHGDDVKKNYALLIIVNRSDCQAFKPSVEADRLFSQLFLKAMDVGVKIVAWDVEWQNGKAHLGKQLPVLTDHIPNEDLDLAQLQKVLGKSKAEL